MVFRIVFVFVFLTVSSHGLRMQEEDANINDSMQKAVPIDMLVNQGIHMSPNVNPQLFKLGLDRMNLTGCRKLFLDIGSNIGTHVRQVFEADKYPKSILRKSFTQWFGDEELRKQPSDISGVCAVGFEANPRIALHLKDIEEAYSKNGWKAFFFAPQAVSDKNGEVTFYMNDEPQNSDVGSSIVDRRKSTHGRKFEPVTIRTLNLAELIETEIASKRGAGRIEKVFAKMDIEGSEFLVLPKMLQGKGMCKGIGIDAMVIEWHDHRIPAPKGCRLCSRQSVLEELHQLPCHATETFEIDDEVYIHDPVPLPNAQKSFSLPFADFFKEERVMIHAMS